MFKFITGKPLWVNILVALGIVVIVLFIILQLLSPITRHGDMLIIPTVTGKPYADAKKILEEKGFEVEIQDSVYNDTAAALAVLRQFPDAEEMVKVNRTVYLTINRSIPPVIEMPNLEGLSFRSAEIALKQYGLKLGDTFYRPDFAKNSVLEQQHNNTRIKPGAKIPMGSAISLMLGSGLGNVEFEVPDMTGMTYNDARILLGSLGLNPGVVLPDAGLTDTLNAFVYRQSPERITPDGRMNRIRQGQSIDIWLSSIRPVRDTLSPPPVPTPSPNQY